jgi:uncharacterized protein HemX
MNNAPNKSRASQALSIVSVFLATIALAIAGYFLWVLTVQAVSQQVSARVSQDLAESTKAIQQAQARAIEEAIQKQTARQKTAPGTNLSGAMPATSNPLQELLLERLMQDSPEPTD